MELVEQLTESEKAALKYRMVTEAWKKQDKMKSCECDVCNLVWLYEEHNDCLQ